MRYFIIYLSHARNAYTYTHAVASPLYESNRAVYGGREMFSIVLCFACLGYKTIWKLKMRISQFPTYGCLIRIVYLACLWMSQNILSFHARARIRPKCIKHYNNTVIPLRMFTKWYLSKMCFVSFNKVLTRWYIFDIIILQNRDHLKYRINKLKKQRSLLYAAYLLTNSCIPKITIKTNISQPHIFK